MSVLSNEQKLQYIKSHIAAYADFPKKGILFRDIFSALLDSRACLYLKQLLLEHIRQHNPDVELIVGLEARGFLLNLMLATELGVGCAPIRKKGKLPGDCVSVAYSLEYGDDIVEIQANAIKPGQKVLIVDDLLATGGTLSAALKLVRKAHGVVVGSLVIMELCDLKGRQNLDCAVHALIKY